MRRLLPIHNPTTKRIATHTPLLNQKGSAAIDYAVILVFVVLGVIAVIVALQGQSDVIFNATATVIGDFGSIPKE